MMDAAPQLIADLADKVAAAVAKRGVEPERAAEIGIEVADEMRADWGGQALYFPKGCAMNISRRDLELFERFNGTNHDVLAREYNLSVIHIYRVVKAVRSAEIKRRQSDLF